MIFACVFVGFENEMWEFEDEFVVFPIVFLFTVLVNLAI